MFIFLIYKHKNVYKKVILDYHLSMRVFNTSTCTK